MIGVYDSGVGGLGIFYEVQRRLPHKDLIYLADTGNYPYGNKSDQEIRQFSRTAVQFLVDQGAQLVIIACNTATVTSLEYLRAWFSLPIIGVVPVVKTAAELTKNNTIGIIGTDVTIQSPYQKKLVQQFADDKEVVMVSNPKLVTMIEHSVAEKEELMATAATSMDYLKKKNVDTIVLGCTHYTLIRPIFERLAGPNTIVLDSNAPVGRQTEKLVYERGLHAASYSRGNRFVTTGDPRSFARAVRRYLSPNIQVEQVELSNKVRG